MNDSNERLRSGWWMIVAVGCVWGLAECVGRRALHGVGVIHHNGSILAGGSMLFFAAGYTLRPRVRTLLMLPLIAVSFRIYLAGLEHRPILCQAMAGNVAFAYFGQALSFGCLAFLAGPERRRSWLGGAAMGAISVVIAANLFILPPVVTGQSACLAPGAALPSSVAGLPYSIAVAALAAPLGFRVGRALTPLGSPASEKGRTANWPIGATVAVASLLTVTLVHIL